MGSTAIHAVERILAFGGRVVFSTFFAPLAAATVFTSMAIPIAIEATQGGWFIRPDLETKVSYRHYLR